MFSKTFYYKKLILPKMFLITPINVTVQKINFELKKHSKMFSKTFYYKKLILPKMFLITSICWRGVVNNIKKNIRE